MPAPDRYQGSFEHIGATSYFAAPVTTAAHLIAIPKILTDF